MLTRRRAVAWLVALNLVSIAICQVGVYEESDEEYEAPGVEDSSLSGYKTQTHDEASGTQYNFVEQAVQEQRSQSGSTGGKSLSELLAGGAEVEVIDLKDGTAPSGLRDIIQQMFSAAKPTKAKPHAPLPSVPPGTPLSQILQSIRQSMHDQPPPKPRASASARHDIGGASDGSYLDHMDATGLELLETELLQKLHRVREAKQRLAARSESGAAPRADAPRADAPRGAGAAAAAEDEPSAPARAASLADALAEALGLRPMSLTALGRSQSAEAPAEDDLDSYAERLAREAQRRERPADGEEGGEADGGSTTTVNSMQDLIQQMMGAANGEVVKFEVVLGDGTEGAGAGGGGLSGLLESLTSQLAGDEDDDSDADEDEDMNVL